MLGAASNDAYWHIEGTYISLNFKILYRFLHGFLTKASYQKTVVGLLVCVAVRQFQKPWSAQSCHKLHGSI